MMADPPGGRIPSIPELDGEVWFAVLTHWSVQDPRILKDADGDPVNLPGSGMQVLPQLVDEVSTHTQIAPEHLNVCVNLGGGVADGNFGYVDPFGRERQ